MLLDDPVKAMKKLSDFLNAIPEDKRDAFASRCGTSFAYLRQIGYGNRPCTEGMAIKLERETDREFTCEELCPEADWAFIRAAKPADTGQAVA